MCLILIIDAGGDDRHSKTRKCENPSKVVRKMSFYPHGRCKNEENKKVRYNISFIYHYIRLDTYINNMEVEFYNNSPFKNEHSHFLR